VVASVRAARLAYRRWYEAAGPWAGFFRAVPLVALAHRGRAFARSAASPVDSAESDAGDVGPLVREVAAVGAAEGWLGRPDVLLLLDLPGAASVAMVAALAAYRVRPVLLLFLWPEPGALVASAALTEVLLAHAPPPPHRRSYIRSAPEMPSPMGRGVAIASPPHPQLPSVPAPESCLAVGATLGGERSAFGPGSAQYAFVLGREREAPVSPADLAARFDNRYSLGSVDFPSPVRLQAAAVRGVVACRLAAQPPAADLSDYLKLLETAGMPIRRLAIDARL
jgi:hypothetical protein